ncbi:MAG: winged helix-turn-helix transcriptional regulator [Lachnospiraceae bacterium]|nr:winged helix-turn-helix transcriptional regulator [Lachnospiraceae bacterium]
MKAGQELCEFNTLYKEMDEIYHEFALKKGISDSVLMIYYFMVQFGDGGLQRDIAAYYCTSKQTIHSSVKKLEEQGFLCANEGRGRDRKLYFTPAGRRFAEEKIVPLIEAENGIFADMVPEERTEFLRLTRKYVSLFREKTKRL